MEDKLEGLPAMDLERGERMHLGRQGMDWRTIPEIHQWLAGRGMAPQAEAHMRMMAAWGKMNVWDQEDFRKAMEMPFAGPNTRWIASIPASVMALILEANPTLLANREEFRKWLKDNGPTGGAQYRVPGAKL